MAKRIAGTFDPHRDEPTTQLTIRAIDVQPNGEGSYTITIPARSLDATESKVLEELFPTQIEAVYKLLRVETLIDSIV